MTAAMKIISKCRRIGSISMRRKISIVYQKFEDIIKDALFYIDKTSFVREWWEMHDRVTLITWPRRFEKTLTMSMIEKFFSVTHTENAGLFPPLEIWKENTTGNFRGHTRLSVLLLPM